VADGINPVIALECIASGDWTGTGVVAPEAFDPVPYLDRLRTSGEDWQIDERRVEATL
jgi:saccharopine dehydrogenase-like NADP-dependent oxidoreductase